MDAGWLFEPFFDLDGQVMLRLVVTDLLMVTATIVLRPADLAILARHVVAIDVATNEIQRLADDLVDAGIFNDEQRRTWVTRRVAALLTRVELHDDSTISPIEARV